MKTTALMAAMIAGFMLPALDASAQDRGERPDFATLDANGDGSVTMEELAAHGNARFTNADTNGDGLLSADELAVRSQGRAAEAVERMLAHLDKDGDGNISQAELPDRGDRMAQMFARADKDDDGVISAEEFEQARPERGRGEGRGHGERHRNGDGEGRGHGPRDGEGRDRG